MFRTSKTSNALRFMPARTHHGAAIFSIQVKAVLIIGGVVAVLVAALVLQAILSREWELDAALCPRERPPSAHVVVLVDPTDPLSPAEERTVQRIILDRKEKLATGARLSVLALTPKQNTAVVQLLFSRCRPPDGQGVNPFIRNKKMLQKQYWEEFEQPLEQAMAAIARLDGADTSPLLESLHYVATMPSFATSRQRTLMIVSDLLEHSSALSQYSPEYAWPTAQQSLYVADVRGRLAGVNVMVLQRRNAKYQNKAHEQFWQAYMQTAGAASYRVQPF